MPTLSLILAPWVLVTSASAQTVFSRTFLDDFPSGGRIADGNVNPWSDTRVIDEIAPGMLAEVRVRLEVSEGFNGDLYAYISHGGLLVPLLNRVGSGTGNDFGYDDPGLNVTFDDDAPDEIHFYRSIPGFSISQGASWKPDGRTVNPLTMNPGEFDAPGTLTLGRFAGLDPEGDWTLVLADVSAGGGESVVRAWGLDIVVIPEPAMSGCVLAAVAGLSCSLLRRMRGRPRVGYDGRFTSAVLFVGMAGFIGSVQAQSPVRFDLLLGARHNSLDGATYDAAALIYEFSGSIGQPITIASPDQAVRYTMNNPGDYEDVMGTWSSYESMVASLTGTWTLTDHGKPWGDAVYRFAVTLDLAGGIPETHINTPQHLGTLDAGTPTFQWGGPTDVSRQHLRLSVLQPYDDVAVETLLEGTTQSWSPAVTLESGRTYEFKIERYTRRTIFSEVGTPTDDFGIPWENLLVPGFEASVGSDAMAVFTAIPEPGAIGGCLICLGAIGWHWRTHRMAAPNREGAG